MILPSQPGLFRRLVYSDYIRRRNTLAIIGRRLEELRVQDTEHTEHIQQPDYEYLVSLPNVEVGLSVKELQRSSKVGFCTKPLFCCICQDTTDKVVEITRELTCQHVFHIRCIETWLSTHKSCPVCRTRLA